MSNICYKSTGQAGRLVYPAYIYVDTPICDVTKTQEEAVLWRFVMANHTHTWWHSITPLKWIDTIARVKGRPTDDYWDIWPTLLSKVIYHRKGVKTTLKEADRYTKDIGDRTQ